MIKNINPEIGWMELLRCTIRVTGHKTIRNNGRTAPISPISILFYYPRICCQPFQIRRSSKTEGIVHRLSLSPSSSRNLSASRRYFETRSVWKPTVPPSPGRFLNIHEQSCGNPLRCDAIRCISGTRVAKGSSRIDALPRNWPWDVIEKVRSTVGVKYSFDTIFRKNILKTKRCGFFACGVDEKSTDDLRVMEDTPPLDVSKHVAFHSRALSLLCV